MTVLITLTSAGASTGPFDLYSDLDGYVSAFETGVSKAALLAGYSSSLVPNGTTTVRIKSTGTCTNYIDVAVVTTTTTTTSSTSTTTTTTSSSTTTTTTTAAPSFYSYEISATSDADPGLACLLSYVNIVYAAESTSAAVTRFYTDMALTTPFTGNGDYYRYTKLGNSDNVRAQVNLGGFLSNIGSC